MERFDGLMPSGVDLATVAQVSTVDATSRFSAEIISASGQGLEAFPYVITVAWESATDTPRLIRETLRALPQPLDVWVQLKLPAGTMTGLIDVSNLHGGGGVILEGNTKLAVRGIVQDTIVDATLSAVQIWFCDLPIHLHSIKADNAGGAGGAIYVKDSQNVKIEYGYVVAGAGDGVLASGNRTRVLVAQTLAGVCTGHGIHATGGAEVRTINNYVNGGSQPALYGQYAALSGSIYRDNAAVTAIVGATGTDLETSGGKVFVS